MDEPPMPDLSHLSAEEREIIEQVLRRQREEEVKETQISQRADEELEQIEKQISERKENAQRLIGTQDDVICQICQKTKFADGIGHKCFYCNLRSCARCGGRAQSKNKAIWACSLCQKKQQILAKTGKWFRGEEKPQSQSPVPTTSTAAAPTTTTTTTTTTSSSATGGASPRVICPPSGAKPSQDHRPSATIRQQPPPSESTSIRGPTSSDAPAHTGNGSVRSGTAPGAVRQSSMQHQMTNDGGPRQPNGIPRGPISAERQRSPRMQDDRRQLSQQQQQQMQMQQQKPAVNFMQEPSPVPPQENGIMENYGGNSPNYDDRRYEESSQPFRSSGTDRQPEFRRTRSIKEEDRRGSIGVRLDQSTPVQPVPAASTSTAPLSGSSGHRQKKTRLHRQIRSMSSSEDELQPTTSADATLGDDARQRVPNECTSERDLLRYIYGGEKIKNGRKSGSSVAGYSVEQPKPARSTVPAVIPGEILAAKIRTYLSHPVTWQPSADQRRLIGHMVLHRTDGSTNGDLGLKVVGGRRSDTGRLGAFVTRVRPGSVADTIGRLRPGDEVLEWNGQPLQNATFDQVYEVISASKNESQVELIVSRSASVPGGDDFLQVQQAPLTVQRHLPHPQFVQEAEVSPSMSPLRPFVAPLTHSQSAFLQGSPRHKASLPAYYHHDVIEPSYGRGQIFGRIELSLTYSHPDRQLIVGVERAFDLPPRPDGVPRNPYAKLFLLPDRSEQSRRQTAVLAEATTPVWGETFYFNGISEMTLMERALEVTVWDYDKLDANAFLGEVIVDFRAVPLDGQPLLFTLADMDDDNPLRMRVRQYRHHGPPRPHSEMATYGPPLPPHGSSSRHISRPGASSDGYDGYGQSEAAMRRSRTYDRAAGGYGGRTTPMPDEDWNIQQSSGYLSDHGQPLLPRHRHRRPRSATAMRPFTAAELGASRMREPPPIWDEPDTPERRYPGPRDPRSPNGRLIMETMQEQMGYGSDGSETASVRSAAQSPLIRTINRRPQATSSAPDLEEDRTYVEDNGRVDLAQKQNAQSMKERKKSLMTRFIPGRTAGAPEAKRMGFARSEEVGIPLNLSADRLQTQFIKQASKESTDSGDNWLPILPDQPLGTFVDNLGPGQVVGRQVLASPVLGEIQLAIMGGRGGIEVELIMARNLVVKPGTKTPPAPYVKVYLMQDKLCVAKAKTNPSVRSTSPLFQQKLVFNENPKHKQLQVTVLGDYGRMERKAFMGIAQIHLDKLQLGAQPVVGWYKLYHSSSLAGTGPVRKDSDASLPGV